MEMCQNKKNQSDCRSIALAHHPTPDTIHELAHNWNWVSHTPQRSSAVTSHWSFDECSTNHAHSLIKAPLTKASSLLSPPIPAIPQISIQIKVVIQTNQPGWPAPPRQRESMTFPCASQCRPPIKPVMYSTWSVHSLGVLRLQRFRHFGTFVHQDL